MSKELDRRLRAFINAPSNFLDALALANALHNEKVWATAPGYAIELQGKTLVPVFTDLADLEAFKAGKNSAKEQTWEERSPLDVLRETIENHLHGLVFNVKKPGADQSNSTLMKTSDMITFVNYYTQILNLVLGKDNQEKATFDKTYLIPAFNRKGQEGQSVRFFSLLTQPDTGKHYIPVFSNLTSFAKWYNNDEFGGYFRDKEGVVLAWGIKSLQHPQVGENRLEETSGFVINPFDESMQLVSWEEFEG